MKRLMPTVGCEADAVAFMEEEQIDSFEPREQPAAQFDSDGSWSIPAQLSGQNKSDSCSTYDKVASTVSKLLCLEYTLQQACG